MEKHHAHNNRLRKIDLIQLLTTIYVIKVIDSSRFVGLQFLLESMLDFCHPILNLN
jgi:hypothetical protein